MFVMRWPEHKAKTPRPTDDTYALYVIMNKQRCATTTLQYACNNGVYENFLNPLFLLGTNVCSDFPMQRSRNPAKDRTHDPRSSIPLSQQQNGYKNGMYFQPFFLVMRKSCTNMISNVTTPPPFTRLYQ